MQGELDFPAALRERVRLLAGLDQRALSRCLDERVHITSGAETLVQTMRAGGASCLLVSGGFLCVVGTLVVCALFPALIRYDSKRDKLV